MPIGRPSAAKVQGGPLRQGGFCCRERRRATLRAAQRDGRDHAEIEAVLETSETCCMKCGDLVSFLSGRADGPARRT